MFGDGRVNVLWIQTDEQRTDSLGCYDNPVVRTPVLDALAARGVVFANHHNQSPVCVPSRVCELTSRYPHQTGVLANGVHYNFGKWPDGLTTFPELFAKAGYVTANFGKYHTPHHPTWLENWHFEGFPNEAKFQTLGDAFDDTEHEAIHRGNVPHGLLLSGRYPKVADGRTPTSHVVDTALDWFSNYNVVRRPFFVRVSFLAPHTPVLAPEPFYSMYDPKDMDWDVPDEAVLASRPRFELDEAARKEFAAHTDEELRRMRCTYYGLVSHIDDQIGRLIKKLDELGELENTVIAFTSDHGSLIGECGQFQKARFYDITTRVPFILAGPAVPNGERVETLTESVDLGPTLLALAGLKPDADMVGCNVLDSPPREDVIGEILGNGDLGADCSGAISRRAWIRTERWSLDYTTHINGEPVTSFEAMDGKLSDLENDPGQRNNLFHDDGCRPVVNALMARFEERTAKGRRPVQRSKVLDWSEFEKS